MAVRQKQSILATFINHPELIEEFGEALGYLDFGDPFLDKLRLDILDITSTMDGLDGNGLQDHLLGRGYDDDFGGVTNSSVLGHAAFARQDAPVTFAKSGVRELLARIGKYQLEEQFSAAQRVVMEDFSEVNWNRLTSLRAALVAVNNGSILEDGF
jgi:DNA primase